MARAKKIKNTNPFGMWFADTTDRRCNQYRSLDWGYRSSLHRSKHPDFGIARAIPDCLHRRVRLILVEWAHVASMNSRFAPLLLPFTSGVLVIVYLLCSFCIVESCFREDRNPKEALIQSYLMRTLTDRRIRALMKRAWEDLCNRNQ